MGPRSESARPTSAAQEDYLKALYRLTAESAVPTSVLAAELGVRPASASEMLSKLSELDLVSHDPYRGARLTTRGITVALEVVRHHRILETYLVVALGYAWDEVHAEADRLEHAISEQLETRMWEALGRPAFDPHGDPIPALDGTLRLRHEQALSALGSGSSRRVSRISDRDPEKLRAIEVLGLLPGTAVEVVRESVWEGPIEITVADRKVLVPLGLAREIFLEQVDG
ncbi:MAG: metal-dependent transcriptional regulator [Candidatus Dormibacteraceae bacterium]